MHAAGKEKLEEAPRDVKCKQKETVQYEAMTEAEAVSFRLGKFDSRDRNHKRVAAEMQEIVADSILSATSTEELRAAREERRVRRCVARAKQLGAC